MTREQLINLLSSSANLMEVREDIVAYINSLQTGAAPCGPRLTLR